MRLIYLHPTAFGPYRTVRGRRYTVQTSALTIPQIPASTDPRFAAAARLIKNGYATMSRQDKAAFGVDTWHTSTDTPEELQTRVAAWIEGLAHGFVAQGFKLVHFRPPFSTEFVLAEVPQDLESKDEILDWIRSNTANASSGVALSSKTA